MSEFEPPFDPSQAEIASSQETDEQEKRNIRLNQARAIIEENNSKIKALNSSGNSGLFDISKLDVENRYWQEIIDNNGAE